MNKFFLLAFSLLASFVLRADNPPIGLGSWREHIPYNKAVAVADAGDRVYCASQFGLFSYKKDDGEISYFTRLGGLSDYEIKTIRYEPQRGILVIAYENSNIDLLFADKTIVNLSDIKRKNIVGGKAINHILFINGKAYLSCQFGIVVINLDRREVEDTYFIGPNGGNLNVQGLAYDGTQLLAVSDSGVFLANFNDPNLFNYTAWNRDNSLAEPQANYTSTCCFRGKFYVVKTNNAQDKDSVLVRDSGLWRPFFSEASEGAAIDEYNDLFMYRNYYKLVALDEQTNQVRGMDVNAVGNSDFRGGQVDAAGNFWLSDYTNGLIRERPGPQISVITPNGPRSSAVWDMDSKGGALWVASGSLNGDAPNYNQVNGVYLFDKNEWKTFDRRNDPVYSSSNSPAVITVSVDPNNREHAYCGVWGGGLLEYGPNGAVTRFSESNSSLLSIAGLNNYIITGGTAFDKEGQLWVVAGGNTTPLSVRKKDGSWQNFRIPDADVAGYGLYDLCVDDFGQKWFIAREGASTGRGLCVYAENDMANPNDNQFRRLTDASGNGSLPDNFVRCIANDKDGALWIGTNKGVAVIYNPGSVFSSTSFDAQKVIIQQDGYNQYLLESEYVTAIAIDGANRKWFGTYSGGAFLMSADGTKQLLNFNTGNSPLASNTILSIAVDGVTGEVFFGTDKGIVSYRGDATEGGEACSDYNVFPNPVRHDYSGPIAVSGLVADADVRITDVAGNVVFHTKALGGQAVWNGNDFSGRRAQTGVYLVYVTNEDGSATCVTRLLLAN
jgi:sugar lactone lactonase YvrE